MKINLSKISRKQWIVGSLITLIGILILWLIFGKSTTKSSHLIPDNKQQAPDGWEYCSAGNQYVLVGELCPPITPGKKDPLIYNNPPRYYYNGQYYNSMPNINA